MIPWAGQDATIVTAQMRGTSPRVLMAIEPHEESSVCPGLGRQLDSSGGKGVLGCPTSIVGSGLSSALDAVARLLGHMFNDILLI